MEKFIIQGGQPLAGEVVPSGNKNAALPLLAACLLTEEPVTLHNMPEIRDVQDMRHLLQSLGVSIETAGNHTWRVQAREICPADLDPDLCKRIRASILLAGPMSARSGELLLPPPGGDVIGRRRVDTHILALKALGVQAEFDRLNKVFKFKARQLSGANIILDEASVLATENTI
ncbi:MAG: UDP-N-acetylglucosamine 1-carboxyvinyltransferase, partial [Omnitrophica WOR_2 bacterium]